MIEFGKLDLQEVQELQNIISKNVEKSELERSYLYTHDTMEKAKIYIWCFRFLYSIRNLTKDGNLKDTLGKEIDSNSDTYISVCNLVNKIEKSFFNRHRNLDRLRVILLQDDNIDDMIDSFAVLLEKSSVLSMSRLKGFVLEGQSGKEFKRIFDAKPPEDLGQDVAQPEMSFIEEPNSAPSEFDPAGSDLGEGEEQKAIDENEALEPIEKEPEEIDLREFIGEGIMKEERNETEQEDQEDTEV